eukprot:2224516-Amphidinium_carterae.1
MDPKNGPFKRDLGGLSPVHILHFRVEDHLVFFARWVSSQQARPNKSNPTKNPAVKAHQTLRAAGQPACQRQREGSGNQSPPCLQKAAELKKHRNAEVAKELPLNDRKAQLKAQIGLQRQWTSSKRYLAQPSAKMQAPNPQTLLQWTYTLGGCPLH